MSKVDYREKCLSEKVNLCNVCGDSEKLFVHHIDGDRSNNALDNLVPLCPSCHRSVHSHVDHGGRIDELTAKLPESSLIQPDPRPDVDFDGTAEPSGVATITVTIDERGRMVIPKPARERLGIDGEEVNAEVEVRVDE